MFKCRRNRVLALCAGERRLLTTALLSFRNKLVASGKPTEDINERAADPAATVKTEYEK